VEAQGDKVGGNVEIYKQLQGERQKGPETTADGPQAQVPQFLSRQCKNKNLIETT